MVVFESQPEQRARMHFVSLNRSFVQSNDLGWISADRRDRGATLVQVIRGLLDRAKEIIQGLHGLFVLALVAQRLGTRQRTCVAVVSRDLRRFVSLQRLIVAPQREVALAKIEPVSYTHLRAHET